MTSITTPFVADREHVIVPVGDAHLRVSVRTIVDALLGEKPPTLGRYWAGGIYAGVVRGYGGAPDYRLIVGFDELEEATWEDATEWARELDAGGFEDWRLPNQQEANIARANAHEIFRHGWYWLAPHHTDSKRSAWCQNFDGNYQSVYSVDREFSAIPVRRAPL